MFHCAPTFVLPAPSRRLFRHHCIFFFFEQPAPMFHCTLAVRFACTATTLPLHHRGGCSGAAASSSSSSNQHQRSTAHQPFVSPALPLHRRGDYSDVATIASVQSLSFVWFIFTFWVFFGFALI
ncbi:hypothetical protein DEO72_LG10g2439 [Vigna unguiculata]|uniref:Uncharacterized protein n=1 Tax=Vigna unguiculata TaxID=3917 RepID=A0A4D6NBY1_VIGUN|nr:hypothetical protein DEO72_LG10g2439 [Vigna unguiculata]